jgi:hypothetical protein
MPDVSVEAYGRKPTAEQIAKVVKLTNELVQLMKSKHQTEQLDETTALWLALAYWTLAHLFGRQLEAAEGIVQMGSRYIAELALAETAGASNAADKPVVH